MRFGELLLIILVAGLSLARIWTKLIPKHWLIYPTIALWIILPLQIILEGFRWQLVPAYTAATVLAIVILWIQPKRTRSYLSASLWTVPMLGYIVFMIALPLLLPIFRFEQPTGTYAVGTTTYHWTDLNRADEYSEDPQDHRELMVQIWYPADQLTEDQKPEPYIHNVKAITTGLESALSFPAWTLSHLGLVHTHGYGNVNLSAAEAKYPIILFSHGMTGFRNQNTFQVEELASHGYIVVGIDHAYDAAATVYPDGREIIIRPGNLSGFEELDGHMPLWTGDVSFVLDQLEKLNKLDDQKRFTGRLDLARIGMFGHSYGGATAAQMLMKDSRIQAAINMDGTLYGEPVQEAGLSKPYLQMNGEKSIDKSVFDANLDKAIAQSGKTRESYESFWDETVLRRNHALANGGYTLTIPHTSHMSFTDFFLFSPLLPGKDEDTRYVQRVINDVSLAFFDQYIKGKNVSTLKEQAEKYPEIQLTQLK